MPNYVTTKEVKNMKKAFKETFKETFHKYDYEDLTEEEKEIHDRPDNDFFGYAGCELKVKPEVLLKANEIDRKLQGEKANEETSLKIVGVIRQAYASHVSHTKPHWYQFFKRYAYWQEEKAIKEMCGMAAEQGVSKTKILNMIDDVDREAASGKVIDLTAEPAKIIHMNEAEENMKPASEEDLKNAIQMGGLNIALDDSSVLGDDTESFGDINTEIYNLENSLA